MVFLDNIIFSLQKHGGVSVLWGNVINKLLGENIETNFFEYNNCESNKIRSNLVIPDSAIIHDSTPLIIERFKDLNIKTSTPAVLHSSHYRVSGNPKIKNVTTVHDFTYEFYFKGIKKNIHCWQKYKAIRNSDVIICISENTKRDLCYFLPDTPKNKIKVIYNGVSNEYFPLNSKLDEFRDYILFVGGRQTYKNFEFAVSCAKSIKKKLLIVGSPLNEKEKRILFKELGPNGFRIILYPSDKELNYIYNSVDCLIYPSLYEGFGIPPIEAQKAGCPVIAMNSSSIPEVVGSRDILLNSSDISEFKKSYAFIEENRRSIIEIGLENAKRFSWEKMSQEYVEIYKSLLR